MMTTLCPLCNSNNIHLIKNWTNQEIQSNYDLYQLQVNDILATNTPEYKCMDCALIFFDAEQGTEVFYQRLSSKDWYYPSDKEEFNIGTHQLMLDDSDRFFTCFLKYSPPGSRFWFFKLKTIDLYLEEYVESLKNISPFHNLPVLKHLKMEPLFRIYQVFPKPGWFYHISRTVTNSPLRHIIPINANKGIIMSSYTDGKDTIVWKKILDKSEKLLENKLTGELRKLFSEIFIPDPLYTKTHYWKNGCTYWLPGLYDPVEAGIKVMTPIRRLPEVFVCGESYSMKQAWVEGALEHAEDMLKRYF